MDINCFLYPVNPQKGLPAEYMTESEGIVYLPFAVDLYLLVLLLHGLNGQLWTSSTRKSTTVHERFI